MTADFGNAWAAPSSFAALEQSQKTVSRLTRVLTVRNSSGRKHSSEAGQYTRRWKRQSMRFNRNAGGTERKGKRSLAWNYLSTISWRRVIKLARDPMPRSGACAKTENPYTLSLKGQRRRRRRRRRRNPLLLLLLPSSAKPAPPCPMTINIILLQILPRDNHTPPSALEPNIHNTKTPQSCRRTTSGGVPLPLILILILIRASDS